MTVLNWQEYLRISKSEKDWNFPKIHTQVHLFDDIVNKGVSVNFNTKFNGNMHGYVKNIFYDLTNYKDVDAIVRVACSARCDPIYK